MLGTGVEHNDQTVSSATDKATDSSHVDGAASMNPHQTRLAKRIERGGEGKTDTDGAVPSRDPCHVFVRMNGHNVVRLNDVDGCAFSNGNATVVQNRQRTRPSLDQPDRHRPLRRKTAMTPPAQLHPDP
jgi:hypothetical protein